MELMPKIKGIDIIDIAMRPDMYPDEAKGMALDEIKKVYNQISQFKMMLEGHIINKMKMENASKLVFIGTDGNEKIMKLKKGSMTPDKNAENKYKNAGFEPLEIGEFVFKPSWVKAKEARKFGGEKQTIIDEIFQEGKPSLIIE
jgi:hypothetical protein